MTKKRNTLKTKSLLYLGGRYTYKSIYHNYLALIFTLIIGCLQVQSQTIRGTVSNGITAETLPNATVVVKSTDKDALDNVVRSAITDTLGRFEIKDVPTGRYTLEARYVGYEPERIVEVLVAGKKEIILHFRLRESVKQLDEVTVTPVVNKARPQNPTALAGAMTISVEEAQRFAGAFDGIDRVVKRYIGTTGSTDNAGISTHGNPPFTTMHRLEGVEIPTPIHFYGCYSQGVGDVSALHPDLLANSDYYTAASPAEMGNTMGGVLDLQLRPGNFNRWEHSVKLSTLGLDINSEGPISKQKGSSYILSYRYGLTKLSNDLGLGILEGDQADYHDFILKLNFPLNNRSNLSLWGVGMWDKLYSLDEDLRWESLYDQTDYKSDINTVTSGITYDLRLRNDWRLQTILSLAHRDLNSTDRYAVYATDGTILTPSNYNSITFASPTPYAHIDSKTLWLTASASVQKRFSSHYLLKFGSSVKSISYEQTLKKANSIYTGILIPLVDANKDMYQIDAYATNNLRFNHWTINAGLHLSGWTLSNDWTSQPRFSAERNLTDKQTLSFGYGMTTRTESYDTYFVTPQIINGKEIDNKDLKPMRSHQFVLDYRWQPSLSFSISSEAWAEFQSAVPVSPTSVYTSLNRYMFYSNEVLVSKGRARNYGISAGAEYYMTNGLYWLANATLYRAEYKASDNVWRRTLYDRGWTLNIVGGKEWKIKNKHILSANISATAMGGLRRTPVDESASKLNYLNGLPEVIYKDDEAMSKQHDAIIDLSFSISYKIHGKRVDQLIGIDYLNILGYEEPLRDYYNYRLGRVQSIMSCYSLPNIIYTIQF